MKIEYDILFEVELVHEYRDGGGGDFLPEPTPSCRRALDDYGLVFRRNGGGFSVWYEYYTDATGKHPVRPMEDGAVFSFAVMPSSPYLLNYSELPLTGKGIYQMDNLNANLRDGKLLLTSDTASSLITGKDRIELKPRFFDYTFETPKRSAEISVSDSLGKEVLRKRVIVNQGVFSCPVDLRRCPPGRFVLKIDGADPLEFYGDDWLAGKGAFAVIDIFKSPNVDALCRFTDGNGDAAKKRYTMKAGARKAFWRYYVVFKNRQSIDPAELTIEHPGGVTFSNEPEKTLSGGSVALPLVSGAAIPFKMKTVKGIKLKKTGAGQFDVENLPNPAPSTLVPDSSGKIYSEVFIYI